MGSHFSLFSYPGSESELQIALIALFSEMLYRFPNMVVAQVTRESVQQAIASGITAQQVSLLSGGRGGKPGCSWGPGWSPYRKLAPGLLQWVVVSCLSTRHMRSQGSRFGNRETLGEKT